MGNADLRDLSTLHEVESDDIEGSVVAVDAYNWLYKYITTTVQWTDTEEYTTSDGVEVPNLLGVVQGLPRFFENDITPVFVFDGGYHSQKEDELADRREAREQAESEAEAAKEAGDHIRAAQLDARSQRLTDEMVETTKDLLDHFDLHYLTAPQSGESQAAYMVAEGSFDYVVSDDYDSILFGSPRTIRNFTSSSKPLEVLHLEDTLDTHDLAQEQLVDVALLCGTDYNPGISGYGPKTALDSIQTHGDIMTVIEEEGVETEIDARALRSIFLSPAVTEEFAAPDTANPDLNAARAYVVDEWGIPADSVETSFERLEEATQQAGLDEWT